MINELIKTCTGWMMCGFFSTASQQSKAAAEFHSRVVDVLDWGSRKWYNVSRNDRGVIFEKS
ncbi:hypothetical protein CPB83DRAFT_861868 [Crepidotus variabilis]|uniref:Uncharacterized protein n=1 Tax=Crepidotus variabilis TaxID=179855 RepID=A0A9P6JKM6_9AGAR|nr:hypothetical protein CPB83DRAFT_861868 [Crepidotus variabilis]